MDITEFVKARLDEDEAAAKAALESEWFAHITEFASANHYDTFGDLAVDYWQWFPDEADGVHVALHNPGRELREVAAKRAILAEHAPSYPAVARQEAAPGPATVADPDGIISTFPYCSTCDQDSPCATLAHLAAAWSDHPDYRAEWRP